ncbi:phosphate ABC transporter permease subunit PstC [Legionella sp. CNM-4043-24]|uniref:phosphate ABC transporter permease subunit PstC n=1 Tax=Legionella sp. CNM-4043-24 TaxID=3421646 RepID=UPI00403B0BC0
MMHKGLVWDRLFHSAAMLFAFAVLASMLSILVVLFQFSALSMKTFGLDFIFSQSWDPNTNQFGAAVPILGTLISSFIALSIATPLSLGIAVFLTQICPARIVQPIRIAVELLAGIPSIVYGIWGLFFFAPFFQETIAPLLSNTIGKLPYIGLLFSGPSMGIGVLPASIILAIMVVPFISAVTRDVLDMVPHELAESAYAMAATKWEVIRQVILPYNKAAILGAVMLGLGRALGETMAVAFVIGNSHEFNLSLLMPGCTISSVLANEFTEASGGLYTSSLVELGLVLFLITTFILAIARALLLKFAKKEGIKR